MKTILNIAIALLLTLGVASCTKEGSVDDGGAKPGTKGLTLVVDGLNGGKVTTYAGEVDPIGNESTIAGNVVTLFQFDWSSDQTGLFVDQYDVTLVANAQGKLEATVDVTGTGHEYIYYVVANATEAKADLALATVTAATTEKQFSQLLSNEAAVAEHLATPLLLTGKSGKHGLIGYCDVTLYRSVARFDIRSKSDIQAKYLDIKRVIIGNAKMQGEIFYDGPGTSVIPKSQIMNLPEITTVQGELVDNGDTDNNNNPILEKQSAFYLYPTSVGSTLNNATTISIVASYNNGPDNIYTVNGPVTILPNTRYILTANPDNFTLGLRIAKWDEGSEEQFQYVDSFDLSKSVVTLGNGTPFRGGLMHTNDDVAASFNVDFKASGSSGVSVSPVAIIAGAPPVISVASITTESTITYAVPYYKSTVVVNVSSYSGTADFGAEFIVTDITSGLTQKIIIYYQNPLNTGSMSHYYPGTAYKAVKVGNTLWAPVNVGATYISEKGGLDYDHLGVVMQWGRNKYFETKEGNNAPTTPSDTHAGPVTYAEAVSGQYKDKFITTFATPPYDWCEDDRETLWDSPLGPCPSGWRLPVESELIELAAKIDVGLFKRWRLEIPGDDGQTLYIPAVGHRNYGTGNSYGRGAQVRIWSTTPGIGEYEGNFHRGSFILSFTVSGKTPMVHPLTRSTAAAVRCVKATI